MSWQEYLFKKTLPSGQQRSLGCPASGSGPVSLFLHAGASVWLCSAMSSAWLPLLQAIRCPLPHGRSFRIPTPYAKSRFSSAHLQRSRREQRYSSQFFKKAVTMHKTHEFWLNHLAQPEKTLKRLFQTAEAPIFV